MCPIELSLDFLEFQRGVDGEIGIADWGAGRGGAMARRSGETIAGTLDFIGIAVAFGAGHGNRLGGNEFAERSALAVDGDVAVFRIGNLQKVHANASQADGLRGSSTFIRGRHLLQIEMIHDKEKSGTDQNTDKKAHARIMARLAAHFKRSAGRVVSRNSVTHFRLELRPLC